MLTPLGAGGLRVRARLNPAVPPWWLRMLRGCLHQMFKQGRVLCLRSMWINGELRWASLSGLPRPQEAPQPKAVPQRECQPRRIPRTSSSRVRNYPGENFLNIFDQVSLIPHVFNFLLLNYLYHLQRHPLLRRQLQRRCSHWRATVSQEGGLLSSQMVFHHFRGDIPVLTEHWKERRETPP